MTRLKAMFRDRRLRGPILLLALVMLACAAYGLPAMSYGADMFVWDDSEYLLQVLQAQNYIHHHGVLSWPYYIARFQHTKPPLYIDSVVPWVVLLGRDRLMLAMAIVSAASAALWAVMVFVLVGRLADYWRGLLAAMAMACLPGMARWLTTAEPDAQLATLVVGTVVMLAATRKPWGMPKAVLLGVFMGLGVLAKTTYPLFVGLPMAYWLVMGGGREVRLSQRVKTLVVAAVVATLVASLWYAFNLKGAFYYAQFSTSYQERVGMNRSLATRVHDWAWVMAASGIGWVLLAIGAYGVILAIIGCFAKGKQSFALRPDFYLYFLLGAIPFIVMSVRTQVSSNTRHPLSSLVLIALAILIFVFQSVERSGFPRRLALTPIALIVTVQFVATMLTLHPAVAARLNKSGFAVWAARLIPSSRDVRPTVSSIKDHVLTVMKSSGRSLPDHWFLSGNTGKLNVSRMRLPMTMDDLPVQLDWCSYFTWEDEKCARTLNEIKKSPCVIMAYEPVYRPKTEDAINNRNSKFTRAFLDNPANGFKPIPQFASKDKTYVLQFYTNDSHSPLYSDSGVKP
jgi:4-amino-4-deoxy-L-arabinose transferase-like glycosyltransferase